MRSPIKGNTGYGRLADAFGFCPVTFPIRSMYACSFSWLITSRRVFSSSVIRSILISTSLVSKAAEESLLLSVLKSFSVSLCTHFACFRTLFFSFRIIVLIRSFPCVFVFSFIIFHFRYLVKKIRAKSALKSKLFYSYLSRQKTYCITAFTASVISPCPQ